jgi:hypothetical protein
LAQALVSPRRIVNIDNDCTKIFWPVHLAFFTCHN